MPGAPRPPRSNPETPTNLTDLPPELLDHIVASLQTSQSVSRLSQANKHLHNFVEQEAWQTFGRTRFPSLWPNDGSPSPKDTVRTLSTLSRAWDRRAFIARSIEPQGDIRAFPGGKKIERWKKPKGQSIGFAPQIDCFEEVGPTWRNRREVLAFSAGAEICIREKKTTPWASGAKSKWWTYRPVSASEGADDITSLHLLRPREGESGQHIITGTANGDLQLLRMPSDASDCLPHTSFVTQGQPVRSSSIHQSRSADPLLAANLGDTRISLFRVNSTEKEVAPIGTIDIPRPENSHRTYRVWSTNFLSANTLAVGLGPCTEALHIYSASASGIEAEPLRKLTLRTNEDQVSPAQGASTAANTSAVYPVIPLPLTSLGSGSVEGQVFLSGAYDGLVRLHDLRSPSNISQLYSDPIDDSAIYSLLARGQESLVAGTSRHSLLKIFDLRLGAKAYSYLDVSEPNTATTLSSFSSRSATAKQSSDWSLFVKPHGATYPGRGGGNNWARRSAESSIYALASPSPVSPYLYAGVENAVMELAFTGVLDRHADSAFFPPFRAKRESRATVWRNDEIGSSADGDGSPYAGAVNLAMHDHRADFRLCTQRTLAETWRAVDFMRKESEMNDETAMMNNSLAMGLDERWRVPHPSKS